MERIFMPENIKHNFNKNAFTYDEYAGVQKKMALSLKDIIPVNKNIRKIFEAGCGTGILSEMLLESLKPGTIVLNDLSPQMLEITKGKLLKYKAGIDFAEGDFERIETGSGFDLVAANAVFQWIKNIDSLFKKVNLMLNKNGLFAFSIFTDGTFSELDSSFRKTYEELGFPYRKHILELRTDNEVRISLENSGFRLKECIASDYVYHFENPSDFLSSVHRIGANTGAKSKVKYSVMKKMFENYKKDFTGKNGLVEATYRVLYCLAEIG
jgi:malonyl-CoA O-methyltransferase